MIYFDRIQLEVPWCDGGISPEAKLHVSYVDTLCEKFSKMCNELLTTIIDKKVTEYKKERVEAANKGKSL